MKSKTILGLAAIQFITSTTSFAVSISKTPEMFVCRYNRGFVRPDRRIDAVAADNAYIDVDKEIYKGVSKSEDFPLGYEKNQVIIQYANTSKGEIYIVLANKSFLKLNKKFDVYEFDEKSDLTRSAFFKSHKYVSPNHIHELVYISQIDTTVECQSLMPVTEGFGTF
jgi:hypothetical protein